MTVDLIRNTEDQKGYLSVAITTNKKEIDYLELAYLQALNIKITQSIKNYAIIIDNNSYKRLKDKHKQVFDEIITVESWSYLDEWKVYNLTPWRETVKIDVDLIFTRDISHWWDLFERNDLVFTTRAMNYKGQLIKSRWHRQVFDNNLLPDIYTALYYFKHENGFNGRTAEFFHYASEISTNISKVAKSMKGVSEKNLGDDEIFALAALIYKEPRVLQSYYTVPEIVHFKNQLNDLPGTAPWSEQLYTELNIEDDELHLLIGHYKQHVAAIHYCDKKWIQNTDILKKHEQYFSRTLRRNKEDIQASTVS